MVPGNSTPGEKSRWRLKEGEFTFQATFSVPPLSSDLLIPDNTHRPRTPRMGLVWSSGHPKRLAVDGWRLSVGRALNCRAGGRGFDYRGREYSQVLKITEKFTSLLVSDCVSLLSNTSCCFRKWSCSSCWARKKPQVLLVIFNSTAQ